MNKNTFQNLSTKEIAGLVRASGGKVCVFPINGTRRWFALEYGAETWDDPIGAYMDIAGKNHVDLYRLFFDHGVDTLLTPVFGAELLGRGDEYVQRIGMDGLARLARHPDFVEFYDAYQVRVRFYGDYKKRLANTPFAELIEIFDSITKRTEKYNQHRLFFGVFASNATDSIAELSVQYFQKQGEIADQQKLIELYYGESLSSVNLFIGFDKFSVFDYPMLASGEEDLYFTVAPSPYLNKIQLREILFDHLYTRREEEPDYEALTPTDWKWIQKFYNRHSQTIFGVGELKAGMWFPFSDLS